MSESFLKKEIQHRHDYEFMADHDPAAAQRLNREVSLLLLNGYNISVGERHDAAYENPEKITAVYDYLDAGGRELERLYRQERLRDIGQAALVRCVDELNTQDKGHWMSATHYLLYSPKSNSKEVDEILEPYREELLFGENQTNSREWHQQRGRATALLTIAAAHELRTSPGAEGRYDTMSGPLDETVFDFQFPEDGSAFSGLSLRDAMMKAEMDFSHKTFDEARHKTDQRLLQTRDFIHAPVTPEFKEVVQYCMDSLGIRSRKHEVNQVIAGYVEEKQRQGVAVDEMMVMSFGCGTALPIMEAMVEARARTGQTPQLLLLDQDPLALASAAVLAEKMGLSNKIELHCQRLFSRFGTPLKLDTILQGRALDIAEDSGLREYLPDAVYKKLTKESWKHLKNGGLMATGNMNKNRPQAEFLHGLMGWTPRVKMRTIEEGLRLHQKAGIPEEATHARVTADGVYTLFFSEKP